MVDDAPPDGYQYDPNRVGFGSYEPEDVPEFVALRDMTLALLQLKFEKSEAELNEALGLEDALDLEYGTPMRPPLWRALPRLQREVIPAPAIQ